MELLTRQIIVELEGEEGLQYIDEYADGNSERGKKMRQAICEKFKFLIFRCVFATKNHCC